MLNKIRGILRDFVSQGGISRLEVECGEFVFFVLLLEDSISLRNYLHKGICIGFKESNVVVASRIEGVSNAFEAKILSFESDNLFMRLLLECKAAENGQISVLASYECAKNLTKSKKVFWHILESEIMVLERFDGV